MERVMVWAAAQDRDPALVTEVERTGRVCVAEAAKGPGLGPAPVAGPESGPVLGPGCFGHGRPVCGLVPRAPRPMSWL